MINIIRKLGNLQDKSANITKLATRAKKNNASYIAFGSFYKSKLKPNAKRANLNILKLSLIHI